mgnify:CR=1 FL=1
MKIGIVTLVGYFNYGNRLQSYALQRAIQNITGETVETLNFVKDSRWKEYIRIFLNRQSGRLKINSYKDIKKELKFRMFSLKYIKSVRIKVKDGEIQKKKTKQFDVFVVGSDQVWNPYYWDNTNNLDVQRYLLEFSESRKKISYAASFGVEDIGQEWTFEFKNALKKFDAISVREVTGQRIVNRLVETQADVVLDPTMLLSNEEWKKLKKPLGIKKKYILIFSLGNRFDNMGYIEKYAKENNYMLINMSDSESEFYSSGPCTFLSLIDNAAMVITDSFHATVFSIIFQTDFIIVNRKQKSQKDMSSRIRTLLKTFELGERYGNLEENLETKCDFTGTNSILEKERARSYEWLKRAIAIGEYK